VADLKLREARDGLESARSIDVPRIAISVNGALAVMGDKEALADLHRAAGEGDVSDRARAVEMCRYLDDEESTALVKNAAESDQRQLQYAATKELQRFRARRE
jgi:HEAT repeat protein